jgi:uncharacterized protein
MALISKSKIEEATARLVKAYQPEAIYLFGSYAWGEPNEDSDVDFMVILNDDAEMAWDAFRIGVYALYYANVDFPTDILVDKKHSFESRSQHPSSLEFQIKNNGVNLYRATSRLALEV